MENNNIKDSDIINDEEKECQNFLQNENNDNLLSKRQLKKIKKREKWLKLKPEKR